MKTFVTDDYRVTLRDNGGVTVLIEGICINTCIIYNPESKHNWSVEITGYGSKKSNSITDLELSTRLLKKLHEALEAVGKQDLFDKEIVFVNKGVSSFMKKIKKTTN